ncbi:MAG TPA: M20/M25/M40 family metallo-hydrolase [Acidimicrobiia bacterium]|jgi:acetylornithine deacetylase/succinyl-diaminopimelate desuccinylase-like protein|nr:M20/M25/M40 family metallo-hydrolase [Acidimicrobiia bacterium]
MITSPGLSATHAYRRAEGAAIVAEFLELLTLENVTGDIPALEANAAELVRRFTNRGARIRTDQLPGCAPVVVGVLPAERAPQRRYGVYVHYDGQPVDPSEWASDPFSPIVRNGPHDRGGIVVDLGDGAEVDPDWRIYARGAADDKAPFAALLAAVDALAAAGVERTTELVFLFEGQEESGSTDLGRYLHRLAPELSADLWLICDGPVHPSGRPQVVFGVRGYCGFELTVYGPERELHSGHFGNWVPNPALELAQLLATCKDGAGTVLIEGFYESTAPITDADLEAIALLPAVELQYRDDLGFAGQEAPRGDYMEHLLRPTFNVRGLKAASTGGGARNVIPSQAAASVDIRLAAGNDPAAMLDLVAAHLALQGYVVLDREPTPHERRTHRRLARMERDIGYPAARSPIDLPAADAVVAAAAATGTGDVVRLPTFGGSVPLHDFNEALRAPVVILPIANYDNNQHAPDENLRIGNLWYGMDLWAGLLTGT